MVPALTGTAAWSMTKTAYHAQPCSYRAMHYIGTTININGINHRKDVWSFKTIVTGLYDHSYTTWH